MAASSRKRWDRSGDSDARRTEILRSVGEVLRERHVSALRMQDIADRLGLTKGNLYYYFKSKQDLLFHCHMRTMEGSLRALETVRAMRGPASERLHRLLVLHIHSVLDESYGAVLLTDLENLAPRQRREYIALRDTFEHGVRDLLREGMDAGEFQMRNVTTVGFAILGGINWISKWYNPAGPETSAAIARTFADLYVAGLQVAPRSTAAGTSAADTVSEQRPPGKHAFAGRRRVGGGGFDK